ncbi:MAG: hypothetical protein OZ913_05115 [Ignavibacteriaceae bacterium]|nr:hypothetical protein [Ignavibacteria bacterium]MEB2329663.1 hypothetical protein [Ignavibacteriaceae bacterium]
MRFSSFNSYIMFGYLFPLATGTMVFIIKFISLPTEEESLSQDYYDANSYPSHYSLTRNHHEIRQPEPVKRTHHYNAIV